VLPLNSWESNFASGVTKVHGMLRMTVQSGMPVEPPQHNLQFFHPMIIGEAQVAYVDGTLEYNNPVRLLMDECVNFWPSRNI
jgi:hypothetical protein